MMIRLTCNWIAVLVLLANLGVPTRPSWAAEPVRLVMRSGRVFTGHVDARTSDEHLVLRTMTGQTRLLRTIDWSSIVQASLGEETWAGQEIRSQLMDQKSSELPDWGVTSADERIVLEPIASVQPELPFEPLIVSQLRVEATAANWDSDVEVDGLLLQVQPLSVEGVVVPVGATLEATLTGRRVGNSAGESDFPQIGRWSVALQPGACGSQGAWIRLPFQGVHPEFAPTLSADALLHVKLTAPGHGTFEASVTPLRIRPYSGLRDRLQQRENRRFFSHERTTAR